MSLYSVPTNDPAYTVELGFSRDTYTYWFAVYEGEQLVSNSPGGELRSLLQLVAATWGYVAWDEATDVARQLRDDAAWVADATDDPASRYLASALSA